MKQGSTLFLKGVIYLMAIATLAICIFALPSGIKLEGEGPYVFLPFIVGMYAAVIPFLIALYQALKLLNLIDQNKAFTDLSIKALKNIKHCAVVISILFVACMPFIFQAAEADDAPGLIIIGAAFAFAPVVVAVFAAVLQKLLQSGIDIKSENDLTV